MFEKSLADMVKGLRSSKASDDLGKYVSDTMSEIKKELRSSDASVKTIAVSKLTYLNMMGYDTTWAAFTIVEVMSLSRFAYKRKGYLAAAQCFTSNTDLVLLCTNLIQKELQSKNPYAIGLAVNCLANIANKDLARVLLNDLITMMSSSRVYIRKKAVLVMYKLFMVYPQGLRTAYPALKRKLQDEDMSVVSCAVNVVCELACKRPKNYLNLAPALFKLLQNSNNNWMLIKIVKLFSNLMSEEPRLARKLMGPLCNIIQSTDAKSLMYECVSTVISGLPHVRKSDGSNDKNIQDIVLLCSSKLREFVSEQDQNLKYLGLVGFSHLMSFSKAAVTEERGLVLQCLSDEDTTIRIRALDLLAGMVTKRNLIPIVQRLMEHIEDSEGIYRNELISKILYICSNDKYAYISNFAWYINILVNLARTTNHNYGSIISTSLIDVVTRVDGVRAYAIQLMIPLLMDGKLMNEDRFSSSGSGGGSSGGGGGGGNSTNGDGDGSGSNVDVLFATSWIIGEYSSLLMRTTNQEDIDNIANLNEDEAKKLASEKNVNASLHEEIIMAMLQTRNLSLPMSVQCAFVHNSLKVVLAGLKVCQLADQNNLVGGSNAEEYLRTAETIINNVVDALEVFTESKHIEVQERAVLARTMLMQCELCHQSIPEDVPEDISEKKETKAEGEGEASDAEAEANEKKNSMNGNDVDTEKSNETTETAATVVFVPTSTMLNNAVDLIHPMFAELLRPVNPKAQDMVPIPEGLQLDEWINKDEKVLEERGIVTDSFGDAIAFDARTHSKGRTHLNGGTNNGFSKEWKFMEDEEDGDIMNDLENGKTSSSSSKKNKKGTYSGNSRAHASGNAFYLGGGSGGAGGGGSDEEDDLNDIPMGVFSPSDSKNTSSSSSRHASGSGSGRRNYSIMMDDELPEGADLSSLTPSSGGGRDRNDSNASDLDLSEIDLSKPDSGGGSGTRSGGGGGGGRHHGGRGRGRKRVDEESDDENEEDGKKKKKKKKDKKEKKEKKEKKKKEKKEKTANDDIVNLVGDSKSEKKDKKKKEKKEKNKKNKE